jgi:hypothetical protein
MENVHCAETGEDVAYHPVPRVAEAFASPEKFPVAQIDGLEDLCSVVSRTLSIAAVEGRAAWVKHITLMETMDASNLTRMGISRSHQGEFVRSRKWDSSLLETVEECNKQKDVGCRSANDERREEYNISTPERS